MSMCRVFSCVVGRGCFLWPVHFLGKTIIRLCPASFRIPRPNLPVTPSRCFLTSYFCIPVPYNEKDIFFGVLVLKGLVGLHKTIQLQLLHHYWLGHRLGLLWYWMVCLGKNRDHSVVFEMASKYCILDVFVDHDGYSISSKVFLPTVVDIMVIWVKSTIPVHFTLRIPRMSMFHVTSPSCHVSGKK